MAKSVEKRVVERLRGFAEALESGKKISERFTCRTIVLDLEPQKYDPQRVLSIRQLLRVSQGLFAQFLGVSVKTVRAWEQGASEPSDMARRFMDEIQRNPEYWRKRLRESARAKAV